MPSNGVSITGCSDFPKQILTIHEFGSDFGKHIYAFTPKNCMPTRQSSADSMPNCDHCGAHVSERFARVFADEYGYIRACPACSANAGIAEVARERAQ